MPSSHTWREICATGAALAATAERLQAVRPLPHTAPLFVACGSSRHLARCAAVLARRYGRAARAVAASALWRRPDEVLLPGERPLVVGLSRSGETTEVVRALEVARARGLATFALTATPRAPVLAAAADGLALEHVRETSVVMTHSFGCLLLATLVLLGAAPADAVRWAWSASERLPAMLDQAWAVAGEAQIRRFVFLGSGPFAPLADEAQLKLQETAQLEAYGFDAWEFRHGPIAVVDPATLVVWLGGEGEDAAVLRDVSALGGRALALPDAAAAAAPEVAVLQACPFFQAVACLRAEAAGRDPDHPPHLRRVVRVRA
jgi:glucosamine--fructose-6-phosphate aminotransferase (isomerizing)